MDPSESTGSYPSSPRRDAEAPRRAALRSLPVTSLFTIVRRSLKEAADDRITTSAASLAFHWFLAIFPTALALIGVVRLIGLSQHQLDNVVHAVGVLLPTQVSQVLIEALRSQRSSATGVVELIVGFLIALWAASEAMAALQVGLDVAYEVDRDRGFFGRRLMALPLIGVTLVCGGAASALLVLGDPIRSLLPTSLAVTRPAFDAAWNVIRWLGAFVLILLLLSTYYVIGPRLVSRRWEWVSPGSIVSSLTWLAASAVFSVYLNDFGHESRTYGAFVGVAALLLWLFLTATSVLAGAELNLELTRPPSN